MNESPPIELFDSSQNDRKKDEPSTNGKKDDELSQIEIKKNKKKIFLDVNKKEQHLNKSPNSENYRSLNMILSPLNSNKIEMFKFQKNDMLSLQWKGILTAMKKNCLVSDSSADIKKLVEDYFKDHKYERDFTSEGEIHATGGPGKIGIFKDTGEITIFTILDNGKIKKIKTYNPIKGQPFFMKFNEDGTEFYVICFAKFHKFTNFDDENHNNSEIFEIEEMNDYTDFHDEEGYDTNYDISPDGKFLATASDRGKKMLVYNLEEKYPVSELSFIDTNKSYSVKELARITPKDCDFLTTGRKVAILFNDGGIKIYSFTSDQIELFRSFKPRNPHSSIIWTKNLFLSEDLSHATFKAIVEIKKDNYAKQDLRHFVRGNGQIRPIRNDLNEHSRYVGQGLLESANDYSHSEYTVMGEYKNSEVKETFKIFKIDGEDMTEIQEIRNNRDAKFITCAMTDNRDDLFLGVKMKECEETSLKSYIWHYKWDHYKDKFIIHMKKNLGNFDLQFLQTDEISHRLIYVGQKKLRIMQYNMKDPDQTDDMIKSLRIRKGRFDSYKSSENLSTLVKSLFEKDHHKLDVYSRDKTGRYKKISRIDLTNFIETYDNGEINFKTRISPDGRRIALISANKARIFEKTDDEKIVESNITSQVGNISSVDFFKDKGVVLGLVTKQVIIYKFVEVTQDYVVQQVLKGHTGWVHELQVSQDSKMIVSCSELEVRIWKIFSKSREFFFGLEKLPSLIASSGGKNKKEFVIFQSLKVKEKVYTPRITKDKKRIILSGTFETLELILSLDQKTYIVVDQIEIFGGPTNKLTKDSKYFINQTFLDEEPAKIMGISDTGLSHVFNFPKFTTEFFKIKQDLKEVTFIERNGLKEFDNYLLTMKIRPQHSLNPDICLYDIIKEMLSNQDFFIDIGGLKKLISYCSLIDKKIQFKDGIDFLSIGRNKRAIKELKRLYQAHGRLNLLFIAIASRVPEMIEKVLENFGYIPFMYEKGFDPLDAALEINDGPSLAVITDYFDKPENIGQFFAYINRDRMFKALDCSSEDFKRFIIRFLISDLPDDNLIEPIAEFPIDLSNQNFYVLRASSHRYTNYLHRRLEEKYFKKKSEIDPVPIKIKTTKIKFSYNVIHPTCKEALIGMGELSDAMMVEDAKYLINQIYLRNRYNLGIKTLLNWLSYIIFCTHTVGSGKDMKQAVVILFFNLFFLGYLVIILFAKGRFKSLKNVDTLMDIYQYTNIPVITYLQQTGRIDPKHQRTNFWINTVILVGGYRALHGLKFFKQVRYMIAIIMQAIIDMLGFAIVMIASYLFFAIVGKNMEKSLPEEKQTKMSLFRQVNFFYLVSAGNWADPTNMNFVEYLVWITSSIFLSIVMMNILIAVVNHTIEQYEEIKELVDVKEQLRVLTELAYFYSIFSCFKCVKRADRKSRGLITILSNRSDEVNETLEAIEDMKKDFERKRISDLNLILKKIGELKKDMEERKEEEEEILRSIKGEIDYERSKNILLKPGGDFQKL